MITWNRRIKKDTRILDNMYKNIESKTNIENTRIIDNTRKSRIKRT